WVSVSRSQSISSPCGSLSTRAGQRGSISRTKTEHDEVITFRSATLALALGLTLAGCMVGPDFRRPEPPTTGRYTETPMPEQTAAAPGRGGDAQRLRPDPALSAQWWT